MTKIWEYLPPPEMRKHTITEGQRQGDQSGPAFLRALSSTDKAVTLLSSSQFSKISLSPTQKQGERFFRQMTSAEGILGNRPASRAARQATHPSSLLIVIVAMLHLAKCKTKIYEDR